MKKIISAAVVLIILCTLIGVAFYTFHFQNTSNESISAGSTAESMELAKVNSVDKSRSYYCEDRLVYSTNILTNNSLCECFYYVDDIKQQEATLFYTVDASEAIMLDFCPNGKKGIYALVLDMSKEKAVISIREIDWDGSDREIAMVNEFQHGEEDNCYDWRLKKGGEEKVILFSGLAYEVLGADGSVIDSKEFIDESIIDIQYLRDNVYLITRYVDWLKQVSLYTGNNSQVLDKLPAATINFQMLPEAEDTILVSADWNLYRYIISKDQLELIWCWSDYGIKSEELEQIYWNERHQLCALTYDGETLQQFTWSQSSKQEKRTELTIGYMGVQSYVKGLVADYNSQDRPYHIVFKEYDEKDISVAMNEMYREMLSGKGPDMIVADSSYTDFNSMGKQGMLEDLIPYMNASDIVNQDTLLPSINKVLQSENKIFMLPTNFSLEFIGTNEYYVEKIGEWSFTKIGNMLAEKPELSGFNQNYFLESIFLNDILPRMQESGTFDKESFQQYMELAYHLPPLMYMKGEAEYRDNKVLLEPETLSEVNQYLYTKYTWGEGFTCMGYPEIAGNGVIIDPAYLWGINSASENKEEAWSIIEELFTKEGSFYTPSWQFSVLQQTFEEKLAKACARDYYMDVDGSSKEIPAITYEDGDELIEIYAATSEDIATIRSLAEGSCLMRQRNTELTNIISEETAAYFQDQKNAEEVTDIIANRIKLYMEERE